ncbi:MAG: M14 family metallopeptidase [Candidatus Aminicenantes bacterium]|nr:M14 family metallopeptidase [Candidatus Aminicenantes bacterium]MDH5705750.1 M14 family metallopeptidase [Candidatus Aminicenantes bacterium]
MSLKKSGKACLCFLLVLSVSLFSLASEKNKPFQIGELSVAPGETKSGYLSVPEKEGVKSFIPVTVINGSQQGKVLALVAGVHGYEYPPILALYRLKRMIDPRSLSGTLIMVHIANIPAFQKRIIYYNPHDWKNLNRVFPGTPEGTLSQRIAHVLTEEVVRKCDFLIDLHCGDGNEALIPYCYWMVSGDEKTNEVSKDMVLAFGIKHIIIDDTRTQDLTDSKYLGNTAILHKKPAITTESGYLGRTDEEDVVRNIQGILSVMKLFKMIEGEPEFVTDPVWIDRYEVVYSKKDGLFYPLTKMGYYVTQGEKVGYITDYFGNVLEELRAPFSGILLYIINTPPISNGEPLFEVGRIKEK